MSRHKRNPVKESLTPAIRSRISVRALMRKVLLWLEDHREDGKPNRIVSITAEDPHGYIHLVYERPYGGPRYKAHWDGEKFIDDGPQKKLTSK